MKFRHPDVPAQAAALHARLPHTVAFLDRVRGLITHELDVTRTRRVD